MYMQLFFLLQILASAISISAVVDTWNKTLCTKAKNDCYVFVKETDTVPKKRLFEVNCDCRKENDISKDLLFYPVFCQYVPNYEDSELIDESRLHIRKCNIIEKEFPLDLLKVLRRSRKLEILIEDSDRLRFSRNYPSNKTNLVINATIINSHITGVGQGWFSGSQGLTLKLINSTIGIVEPKFIFDNDDVSVALEDSNITTFKMSAISLPADGTFSIIGGRISQIEELAFEGGNEISIKNAIIHNIGTNAFNVMNVQSFTLADNTIASMDEKALRSILSRYGSNSNSVANNIGKVNIKRNKFIKLHRSAFAGLCDEASLTFENNFIQNQPFVPRLQSESCTYKRMWETTIWDNEFNCLLDKRPTCEAFEDATDDQTCLFFRTSWCLCNDKMTVKNSTSPKLHCRTTLQDFLRSNCEPKIAKQLDDDCKQIISIEYEIHGRSLPVNSSGNAEFINIILLFIYYIYRFFV